MTIHTGAEGVTTAEVKHGITVVGTMPEASAQRHVSYTWSDRPKSEFGWIVAAGRFGDPYRRDDATTTLLGKLINHQSVPDISHKDKGFTWSAGIISGEKRTDNAVTGFNGPIAFDFDLLSDADVDRLKSFLTDWGPTSVLVSSISHRLPFSNVPVGDLRKFAEANGLTFEESNLVEIGRAYLASKPKKYFPETIASVHAARIVTTGRDTPEIDIYHAPQNRYRLVVLEKDPRPCDVLNVAKGEADHRQFYIDMCELLAAEGFNADRSCSNRARLFYGSRHIEGMSYDVTVFCGSGQLDAATVPQTEAGRDAAATYLAGKGKGAKAHNAASGERRGFGDYQFRTPWLPGFIRDHAQDFQGADWYGTRFPDDVRNGQDTDKVTGKCPWEDATHGPTAGTDVGWIITNPGTLGDGFSIVCRHDTCNGPDYSNGDRARHLDKLIADFNDGAADGDKITEAELLEFCPTYQTETVEKEKAREASGDAFEAALEAIALLKVVDGPTVVGACDMIVSKYPDDRTGQDGDALRLTRAAAGWDKRMIERAMSDARARAERRAEAETPHTYRRIDTNVPDDTATATTVFIQPDVWDKPTQCRVTQARWEKLNRDAPNLYRLVDGSLTQINLTAIDPQTRKPDPQFSPVPPADFTATLGADMTDRAPDLQFVAFDEDGAPRLDVPPGHVLTYLRGKAKTSLDVPTIERIQRVPVFVKSPSGEPYLLTKPGYDAGSGLYYAPPGDAKFYDAPTKPTADDLVDAIDIINDADRDMPYFDGDAADDDKPIRGGEVDADGHPLPNYERGASARTNFRGMCLQPFVRNLIAGPCPQYHIDKPDSGTGAGLLVDVFANVTNWQDKATVKTLPHGDEEIRKTLLSMLRAGKPYGFIDNVQTGVTNPDLMAMLTAGVFSGRMLGGLTDVEVAVRLTMIMAGNNIPFQRDMLRRNVWINLDAATPNPETDRGDNYYKHPRLLPYLRQRGRREALIWAYQVLAFNWLAKGCPAPEYVPALASFEEYTDVIGGILEAADITGFLGNRQNYMADRADDDIQPPHAVTIRIYEKCGTDEKTVRDLLDALIPVSVMRRLSEKVPSIDPELGLSLKGDGQDEGAMLQSLGHRISGWRNTFAMPDGAKVRWHKRKTNEGVRYSLRKV